jgi:DNA polymerase-3 subunit gamma/tau
MSLTLYRKYRPKLFAEVEGQEHIVRTLEGALLSGRVGHAYLFCGPRGTGKTTVARLFAKSLNCTNRGAGKFEPCNNCDSCLAINEGRSLDLIEIDAASNRGIDEIRNLKDSARVAAASSNYKIFIVDEVHMLTKDAFNALLKTLEEPPSHVIFIMATTEPHKILETILSRVQRFDFKKISPELIIRKLKKIAKAEKIILEPEVLTELAGFASGSLRDAESALAKLMAFALPARPAEDGGGLTITSSQTLEILGIVPTHIHAGFFEAIIGKNTAKALSYIAELHESGVDLDNFIKQFLNFTRAKLITLAETGPYTQGMSMGASQQTSTGTKPDAETLIRIINAFIAARTELKNSPVPQLPLELAVMELTR